MLNVKAVIVSKMTNHSAVTVRIREESKSGISGIRKESEKRCDLRRQQKMESERGQQ